MAKSRPSSDFFDFTSGAKEFIEKTDNELKKRKEEKLNQTGSAANNEPKDENGRFETSKQGKAPSSRKASRKFSSKDSKNAVSEAERERRGDSKKVLLSLPVNVHKRLKLETAKRSDEKATMSSIVCEALGEYWKK